MGQFKHDGMIYEELPNGKVRVIGPDTEQSAPRPMVTQLPATPQQQARERRDEGSAYRDTLRTDKELRDEQRGIGYKEFDHTGKLRDEFSKLPQVREYQTVIRQYSSALKTQPTPTGDQALITAYAKMLDPGSVVREQEFNTVAAGDSTIGQIVTRLNKELGVDGAGMLRPEVRERLREEMLNLTRSYNTSYNQARDNYAQLATRNGIDPQSVVGQHYGAPYFNGIKDARLRARLQQPYTDEEAGGLHGTVTDESGSPAPATPPDGFSQSYVGQGMSGVNEGIANSLGLPIDVVTAVMNLAPKALNAAAGTDIPQIDKPFLGSEWIKDQMDGWAIRPQSGDPSKQFVRRMGQSVGAASVPLAGTSGSLRQMGGGLLGAAGGGAGAATAQQAFPGNPVAEFAGELIGSGVTGGSLLAAGRRGRQRQIEAQIPTVDQLKDQAGTLYRQAESRGVTADPQMTQDLADQLRQSLADDGRVSPTGRISDVYPKAKEAMQLADDYAGQTMNPTQIQTVRGIMSDGLTSADANERRIARNLTDTFDAWANPQAPELAQARNIASRYLNAQQLERARELAGVRAGQFSGSGFENALRTEYRALDRNAVKGNGRYGADLENAIQNVSRGTPMSNAARDLGKFAPTGVVSFGLGTGLPAAIATSVGGPGLGAAVGATTAGLGTLGRVGATYLGRRNADVAELVARNGGAIPQAPLLTPETERAVAAVLASQQAPLLNPPPAKPKRKQRQERP